MSLLSQAIIRHNQLAYRLIVIVWVLFSHLLYADHPDTTSPLRVSFTTDRLIEADPDEVITLSALIENRSNEMKSFEGTFVIPNGWHKIPEEKLQGTLSDNQSTVRIFAVKVSPQASVGNYPIKVCISNEIDEITVRVKPKTELNCKIVKKPLLVSCGEPFGVSVSFKNTGNILLHLAFEIKTEPFCEDVENEIIAINPGETLSRSLCFSTPNDYKSFEQYVFFRVKNQDSDEILWQQAAAFPVFPKGLPEIDPYVKLPMIFRMALVGQRGQFSFVPELSGEGTLDKENDRHCEFVLRAPSHSHNVIYEQYQRFYVNVWQNEDWDIEIGDTGYSQSPLLERWRYGRGVGMYMNQLPFGWGFLYAKDIYKSTCDLKEFGTYLEYQNSAGSTWWLNYMNKNEEEYPESNLIGLEYEYAYDRDNVTHMEAAHDFIDSGCHGGKNGFTLMMKGRFQPDSWYSLEKSYAGHSFFGTYRDLDLFAANIDSAITPQLRVNSSVNFLKQGLDIWDSRRAYELDSCLITAPHQRQYNIQTLYNFMNGCTLSLTGLIFNARDKSFHPQYNFRQKWGGVNFGINRQTDSFLMVTSFGQQRDLRRHHNTHGLQKYYFFYTRNLTSKLQMSMMYDMGNLDYFDAKPWRYGFGASMRYIYDRKSWASIFAQKARMYPSGIRMTQVAATWGHFFENDHQLFVSTQYFHFNHRSNDWQFLISYAIPFDAPIGYRRDIGSLHGRVIDRETMLPVANALLSLGDYKIMSDGNGLFGFQGIAPGEYDFKTEILPNNLITQGIATQRLSIAGGHQEFMELMLVRSCSICGEIQQFVYPDDLESQHRLFMGEQVPLRMQNPLAGVRIIVQNEETDEGYSFLSTHNGNFNFRELGPGRWRVSVIEADLPEHFQLEQVVFDLTMEPGQEQNILFKVIPEKRPIKPLE